MLINRNEENVHLKDIVVRGQEVKLMEKLVLGECSYIRWRQIKDIERREIDVVRAYKMPVRNLRARTEVSLKIKMRIFSAAVLPVLLY